MAACDRVRVRALLIELGRGSGGRGPLELVVLELHHSLVGSQVSARIGVDAHVAGECPAAVFEVARGGQRPVRSDGHLSVGDGDVLQMHHLRLEVGVHIGRVIGNRWRLC